MIKNMYVILAIFQIALIAISSIGIYLNFTNFYKYRDDPLTKYFYIINSVTITSVIISAILQLIIYFVLNKTNNFYISQLENCCIKKY